MQSERFHLGAAEILVGSGMDETVRIVAGQLVALVRRGASEDRVVNIALSGGITPQRLFLMLSQEPFVSIMPWRSLRLFWVDERNVSPTDAASNYGTARRLMLHKVPLPPGHIHPIPTGGVTALIAADLYQRTLREWLPVENGWPRFDLVLLGIGENGHTASLFPYRPTLHERERLVVADHIEELAGWRVTLTVPMINNAAQIVFLVTGEGKSGVVREVLMGERDPERLPAQQIEPVHGTISWVLDPGAARELSRQGVPSPAQAH